MTGKKPGPPFGNPRNQITRDRISAARIIDRLQAFIFGEIELSGAQVRAIEIALKKVLPDLTSTEMEVSGPNGGPIEYSDTERAARITDLLDAARARRTKQLAAPEIVGTLAGPPNRSPELES